MDGEKQPDDLDWQSARGTALTLAIDQDDLATIRKWASEPGGFGSDETRRRVWPYLLHVQAKRSIPPLPDSSSTTPLPEDSHPTDFISHPPKSSSSSPRHEPHPDESQVSKDTNRAFVNYPSNLSRSEKDRLKGELNELIVAVLRRRAGLSYFQGYHDIISILYLTFFPYTAPIRSTSPSTTCHSTSPTNRSARSSRRSSPVISRSASRSRTTSTARTQTQNQTVSKETSKGEAHSRATSLSNIKLEGLMQIPASAQPKNPLDSPERKPGLLLPPEILIEKLSNTREDAADSKKGEEGRSRSPRRRNGESREWEILLDCVENFSLLRVRDGMGSSLGPIVGYLRLMSRLIKTIDPELSKLINQISPTPYFALSWLLTLFSHDTTDLQVGQRIFDYLLCRNPVVVVYMGVALVLLKKKRLERLAGTVEDDPGILHTNLSVLPVLIADEPGGGGFSPKHEDEAGKEDGQGKDQTEKLEQERRETDLNVKVDDNAYISEENNPQEPILLSELFKLTDSLFSSYPPGHPKIRASEILREKSVIWTYELPEEGIEDVRGWIEGGVKEEEVVDVRETKEDEPVEEEVVRRLPRRRGKEVGGRRLLLFSAVVLVLGVMIVRNPKFRTGLTGYLLRRIGFWKREGEMEMIWARVRFGAIGRGMKRWLRFE